MDKGESLCRLAGNKNPKHRRGSLPPDDTGKLPLPPGEVQEALAITEFISPILTISSNQQYPDCNHHEIPRSWAQMRSSLCPCSQRYKSSLHQTSPHWGFHTLISFKNIQGGYANETNNLVVLIHRLLTRRMRFLASNALCYSRAS